MTPGLQRIDSATYQADPAPTPSLSAGLVDILTRESPLHAWTASPRLNPEYREEEDEKFDIGKAGHSLLFEGIDNMEVFEPSDYPNAKGGGVATGWTNKAIRTARDDARARGKIPVLKETSVALRLMVSAARAAWEANDDLKGYGLDDGFNEVSIFWQEKEMWCRCRPDHLSKDRRLIVDAKFTDSSANPWAFERQIDRMGYDSRAAFYLRGNAATGGQEDARYVYLIQEVKPPYAAAFIGLDPSYMDLGRRKIERAINAWRSCMASGKWPGYLNRVHYAAPPAYAIYHEEEAELRSFEYSPEQMWGKP